MESSYSGGSSNFNFNTLGQLTATGVGSCQTFHWERLCICTIKRLQRGNACDKALHVATAHHFTTEKIAVTQSWEGATILHSIIWIEIVKRWWTQTKSFLKIFLLSVNFGKLTSVNQKSDQSQSGVWRAVISPSSCL